MRRINALTMIVCLLTIAVLGALAISTHRQATEKQHWLDNEASNEQRAEQALQHSDEWRDYRKGEPNNAQLLEQIRLRNSSIVKALIQNPRRYPDDDQRAVINAVVQQPDGAMLELLIAAEWKVSEYDLYAYLRWVESGVTPNLALLQKYRSALGNELDALLRTTLKGGSLPMVLALHNAGFDLLKLRSAECCSRYSRRGERYKLSLPNKGLIGGIQSAAQNADYPEVLGWFIRNGVDVNTADSDGKTALMHAASKRNFPAMMTLLEAGANPNSQDNDGRTALMYSVVPTSSLASGRAYYSPLVRQFFSVEQYQALLAAGCSLEITDNEGASVLLWASRYPDIKKRQLRHNLMTAFNRRQRERVLERVLAERAARREDSSAMKPKL